VALVFPTGFEFLDALFGVLLAGAVPVPLYPPAHLGRLDEYHARTARMLTDVGACLVLADRRVRRIVGETISGAAPRLGCLAVADLVDGVAPDLSWPPADLGLIQFSSGTTADPKPVALSQRALVAQAVLLNGFWPTTGRPTHSGVSWLPLYHDMGSSGRCSPRSSGPARSRSSPDAFRAAAAVWLRALSDHGATVSRRRPSATRDAPSGSQTTKWPASISPMASGAVRRRERGAAVLRAFAARFARWGFAAEALTPVYGLAEATLAVTFSDLRRPFVARRFAREALAEQGVAIAAQDGVEIASVGRAVPGFEIRIVGDRRRVLPERRVGIVECRGRRSWTGTSVSRRRPRASSATAGSTPATWGFSATESCTWRAGRKTCCSFAGATTPRTRWSGPSITCPVSALAARSR